MHSVAASVRTYVNEGGHIVVRLHVTSHVF
jgi:hypothetical protein